jgi:hypothetical protein
MQKKTVLVLSITEAKEELVKHFTKFLVDNPAHLSTLLREGKLNELPNFSTMSPAQVTQMFRDNQVLPAVDVDAVLVQNRVTLEVVAEKQPVAANCQV